ncbi:hypothetical protein SAMN04487914_108103 [Arthrobacter sp. ok909]|uniref:hypothetical protein n=1 Tax=Arthrobacter sp. ok909 TaxID=1761746 RepID=UPI00088A5148|nr:hypothetical protein [Arthrobacter sp. ok909]SDP33486.1 hypothetical protein SAMN04487914_108103 [Arthrobacter sp. ok909]
MDITKRSLVVGLVVGLMLAAVVTSATPYVFTLSAVTLVLIVGLIGVALGLVRR